MKAYVGRRLSRWLIVMTALALTAGLNTASAADEEAGPDDPRVQLLNAIYNDDVSSVHTLLDEGVDPNIREVKRGPALMLAVHEQSIRSVRELLASPKLKIDAVNARGETALMMAALIGQSESVGLLIEKGAQINREGWTPLHYAATNGHLTVIKQLIEAGADKNALSPNGTTPMMMAIRRGNLTAYQSLLVAGADPTVKNQRGLSAIDYLERSGESERAQLLREYAKSFTTKSTN
ncbi:MAG: ankyrin repeat domain-containing protein [Burkholderiaceae bacterium]